MSILIIMHYALLFTITHAYKQEQKFALAYSFDLPFTTDFYIHDMNYYQICTHEPGDPLVEHQ